MTYLVDSNIFIYAMKPDDEIAAQVLIDSDQFYFASIARIEVLGYNRLCNRM